MRLFLRKKVNTPIHRSHARTGDCVSGMSILPLSLATLHVVRAVPPRFSTASCCYSQELTKELEKSKASLASLVQQHDQLKGRHEREAQEGANLLKMLRDDLERINTER